MSSNDNELATRPATSAATVETFMTIEEVAAFLRVKVATIRWLRQEGRFAPASHVGRRLVWARSDVQAWAIAQREAAA